MKITFSDPDEIGYLILACGVFVLRVYFDYKVKILKFVCTGIGLGHKHNYRAHHNIDQR